MDELDDIFGDILEEGGGVAEPTVPTEPVPTEPVPTEPEPEDDDFFGSLSDGEGEPLPANVELITDLLKAKGIENNKITIIDEEENEQEVDFFELSKEEQLEVLNYTPEVEPATVDANLELQEAETELINTLRKEGITLEEYLEKYTKDAISELGVGSEKSYDIDAYDDQELFLLDMKTKFELTDEELTKELEKELQDEELFKKKVSKIREEYKQLEDEYKEEQQKEFEKQKEEEYGQFVNTMVDVAVKTPEFHGIELEDDEKNEVLSFLLELDDNGTTEFYKSLNDPAKLYEAAWFMRYGRDAFEAIKNAYESEIANLKKPDNPKKVVVKKKDTEQNNEKNIHDLF